MSSGTFLSGLTFKLFYMFLLGKDIQKFEFLNTVSCGIKRERILGISTSNSKSVSQDHIQKKARISGLILAAK